MDWLKILFAVALLAHDAAWLIWLGLACVWFYCRDDKKRRSENAAGKSDQHGENAKVSISDAIKAIEEHLKASSDQQTSREERRHQVEVAAVAIAFVYATVTILLWCTSQAQLNAMRLSQRPWVLLRDISVTGDFEHTGNGNFVAGIRNEGGSPAFDVRIVYGCWPGKSAFTDKDFESLDAGPLNLVLGNTPGEWPYLGKDAERGRQDGVTVDAAEFAKQKLSVYCVGMLRYWGPDFGSQYTTSFARRYFPHPEASSGRGSEGAS